MTDSPAPRKFTRADGETIAWLADEPQGGAVKATGVLWLGGFKSDMTGTKAEALGALARRAGRRLVRFDYFGHGQSSGRFTDGTIGRWIGDALAVLDELTEGPQILVGSSMGGWITLHLALARPERVSAIVLIAPAPDFTESLMWENFSPEIRETLRRDGLYAEPSDYGEPYEITLRLIEEGRNHLLLDGPINLAMPVRILQGMKDADVPWRHALRLIEALGGDDAVLTLIRSGDHRLSTAQDIARLEREIEAVLAEVEA